MTNAVVTGPSTCHLDVCCMFPLRHDFTSQEIMSVTLCPAYAIFAGTHKHTEQTFLLTYPIIFPIDLVFSMYTLAIIILMIIPSDNYSSSI